MRWFLLVAILAFFIAGCEPEYVSSERIDPIEAALEVESTIDSINALVLEHGSAVADMESRLALSEEQIAFDVTSAKRRIVGRSGSTRTDVSDMIDVHEHNALSEIARARSRLHAFDSNVRRVAAEQIAGLALSDPTELSETDLDAAISAVEEAVVSDAIEASVTSAQQTAASASDAIDSELEKLGTTPRLG